MPNQDNDSAIPAPPTSPPDPPESSPPDTVPMEKEPVLAAILSLFPGAGNIYNGLYLRGVTFFVLAASSIYMANTRGALWGLVIAFVWIFNVLDSWRQAKLINLGYATDLGQTDQLRPAAAGSAGRVGGIAVFLVGLVAMLEIYLDIDVDWIFDLWPIVLMGLGAWFIFSSLRAKREARTDDLSQPDSDL